MEHKEIPLQLFQVAATAIPTVLVALMFTARLHESMIKKIQGASTALRRYWEIFKIVIICVIFPLGELAALVALARGHAGWVAAAIVVAVIVVAMCTVVAQVMEPIFLELSPMAAHVVNIALFILLGGGAVYAVNALAA